MTPQLRMVRVMLAAWFGALVVLAAVMLALAASWDGDFGTNAGLGPGDETARLGTILAGLAGLVGLVAAAVWRNRVTAGPVTSQRLFPSYLVATAVAESGVLIGAVFAIVSQRLAPFWLGAALFSVALVLMATALPHIEVQDPEGAA